MMTTATARQNFATPTQILVHRGLGSSKRRDWCRPREDGAQFIGERQPIIVAGVLQVDRRYGVRVQGDTKCTERTGARQLSHDTVLGIQVRPEPEHHVTSTAIRDLPLS